MLPEFEGTNFIESFRSRRLAILFDDSGVNQRAVLVTAAEDVSYEIVNEILEITGGLLFVALSPERSAGFMLSSMARPRTRLDDKQSADSEVNMCVSVEAREGVTTGISVSDRMTTIRILGEESPNPRKLVRPGHIFPMEARRGGVLVRNSLCEGALDTVTTCGYRDAALYADLLSPDGEFMHEPQWKELAATRRIPLLPLSALIRHRLESETLVQRIAEARLPTESAGELKAFIYKSTIHTGEHLALVKGVPSTAEPVLTRVQTEHTFSDVFGGGDPGSRKVLHDSLRLIGQRGSGILVYLRRPQRGQLREQLRSVAGGGAEPPSSIIREYGLGAQILRDLGVQKIELLTNTKKNLAGLRTFGIEIVGQHPISPAGSPSNGTTLGRN